MEDHRITGVSGYVVHEPIPSGNWEAVAMTAGPTGVIILWRRRRGFAAWLRELFYRFV